jgi:prolyl-tRNA synthetase
VSTRLIGALIMTHGDDDGLRVPPRIAPTHAVILPIYRDDEGRAKVMEFIDGLMARLKDQRYDDVPLRIEVDDRDLRGGEKNWGWIKRGVPVRIEVGPRDVESGTVMYARRDKGARDKATLSRDEMAAQLPSILGDIQKRLFEQAKAYRKANTHRIDDHDEFVSLFKGDGGFAMAHWCGDREAEEKAKEMKVTIRCIPLDAEEEPGRCIITGKPSKRRVLFARSY